MLDGFHEHHMPLAALHLDIDYMDGYRLFTVNRRRFPDLEGMIARAHTRGVRVVAIVDAGVKRDARYRVYPMVRKSARRCGPAGARSLILPTPKPVPGGVSSWKPRLPGGWTGCGWT